MYLRVVFSVLAALFLAAPAVLAQSDAVEWPAVKIVLTGGDTITSPVIYYRSEDVLSLPEIDGTESTLTPVLVSAFEVPDPNYKFPRQFRTFLWNRGRDYSDYLTPAFFEQLNTGNYSLLKRETLRNDIVRSDPFLNPYGGGFQGPGFPRWVSYLQESFFLHTPKGNIISLRSPKRDLKRIFSSKHKLIKQFVRDNDLSYNRRNDLVRIVDYYNSLTDPNYQKPATLSVSEK